MFIRLLAAAAGRVLAIVEQPRIISALDAVGSHITIHSFITGSPRPLTSMNCEALHLSAVTALALALAVPWKHWSEWARMSGIALGLVFLAMVAVSAVQAQVAAERYAAAHLGLTLYTTNERTFLDWAIRKSSLAIVFVVPALLFLASYISVWPGVKGTGETPLAERLPHSGRWWSASTVLVALALWLIPALGHQSPVGRAHLDALQKIATLNPNSAHASYALAVRLESEGSLDEALDAYETTLRLEPDLVNARFGAGNVLFAKSSYEDAARSYEEVLRREPRNTGARLNLGNAFLMRGLFDRAAEAYEAILETNPDHAFAHKNLGEAFLRLHRRCDALPHLERSIVLDRGLSKDAMLQKTLSILRSRCESMASRCSGVE